MTRGLMPILVACLMFGTCRTTKTRGSPWMLDVTTGLLCTALFSKKPATDKSIDKNVSVGGFPTSILFICVFIFNHTVPSVTEVNVNVYIA